MSLELNTDMWRTVSPCESCPDDVDGCPDERLLPTLLHEYLRHKSDLALALGLSGGSDSPRAERVPRDLEKRSRLLLLDAMKSNEPRV